jgi:UDP-N-acetylglucosamine--dolichyl-phosphate N-acetylglucosaminephosphotransferase
MTTNWQVVTLIALTFTLTMLITPYVIWRMRVAGILGTDVNKRRKPKIPEMCGIAGIVSFAIAGGLVAVVFKMFGRELDLAILAALSAMTLGGIISLIDDLYGITRWGKAIYVAIAGMPLAIVSIGNPVISTPWFNFDFSAVPWLFWLVLVPIGITGVANAMNMSAGYNGVETGQMSIISGILLVIAFLKDPGNPSVPIFALLLGASVGLFFYNRYPAKMFIGDVGTLGMGAGLGAGIVIGGLELYGLICMAPAFYELFASIYYTLKGVERRPIVMKPVILKDGRLKVKKETRWYTMFFRVLGWRPMREDRLVASVLMFYLIAGMSAIAIMVGMS